VPTRRYDQFCGLARTLELVGERWTLLVVRELLDGPKRYGDLLTGLAPVATDVLASRLRELEAAGLVARVDANPPATGRAYALTDEGAALEPAVDALARWGVRRLDERRPTDVVRPRWLAQAVRALARPDRTGVDLVLRLVVPEGAITLHVTDDAVVEVPDAGGGEPSRAPDVVLTGEAEALAGALYPARAPALVAGGALRVDATPEAAAALATLFR